MNYSIIKAIGQQKEYKLLDVKPWMFLEIQEKIWDWNNARIWRFKWLVLKVRKPNNFDGSFTIRGESSGVKIEKIYPLSYTKFEKVEVIDEYKIRRAKLYYMRDKVGKSAKMKSALAKDDKNKLLSYRSM